MGHGSSAVGLTSKETEQYRQHKLRRREVEGCAVCGIEINPGCELMVCSERFDRWTMCMKCFSKLSKPPNTIMYKERVLLELDPAAALSSCTTASAALEATLRVYCDRPCLGFPIFTNGFLGPGSDLASASSISDYRWLSYLEVLEHASLLAVGLKFILHNSHTRNCESDSYSSPTQESKREQQELSSSEEIPETEKHPNQTQEQQHQQREQQNPTVLLFAPASVEWYLMQYACILGQLLVVPVLDGTPRHQAERIIERCHPKIIITSPRHHEEVVDMLSSVMSNENLAPSQVCIILLSPVSETPYPWCDMDIKSEACDGSLLLYSSANVFSIGEGYHTQNQVVLAECVQKDDTPRMLIPTSGSSGDPKLIMVTDDMMLRQFKVPSFGVRTVMYSFLPLRQSFDTLIKGGSIGLWSGDLGQLHRDMMVLRPTHFGSTPVFWMSQLQKFNAEMEKDIQEMNADELLFDVRSRLIERWREKRLLGNRCKSILVGGAPSSAELRTWIWEVFGCHVADGYGTSETGAIATNTEVSETSNLRLIDVPDMGYLTSDMPYPRGEIVAHTKRMTPGYYNDTAANAKAFVKIGEKKYFRTGDIGMLFEGKVTVIDRKTALFKLPNGVFVAPAPLEILFAQSPLIKQALVFGASNGRSVSMLVVLTSIGIEACSFEKDGAVEMDAELIRKECAKLALEAGRKEYEIPYHVVISTEEWTVENGCLTSSLKPCRPVLLKKFAGNHSVNDIQVSKINSTVKQKPFLENVGLSAGLVEVLRETVPVFESNDAVLRDGNISLYSLGVDSLALAMLRSAVQSRFGIDIPLPHLSETTLYDLNAAILGGGVASLPDIEYGPETLLAEVRAICSSWSEIDNIRKLNCVVSNSSGNERSKVVLLTGATGFVGAFLLDQLLKTDEVEQVMCLIRAESDEKARERLVKILQRYQLQCPSNRWSVVIGDLTQPKFGMEEEKWNRMLHSINVVYHAGAIVNASQSFKAIHAANVLGTKTIIEFCLAADAFLHHISSISALGNSGVTEETFNVPAPGKHATAYAKSKWAAEQIVGWTIKNHGLLARIYRLGTMGCHSQSGACNPNDTFTRIVEGIISLQSYTKDDDSPFPDGFYLAPIDWAVELICNIASDQEHNVSNEKCRNGDNKIETVEVVHILSNQFLPISTVFSVIIEHELPLSEMSAIEFKAKLDALDRSNPMFTFKDLLTGAGLGRRKQSAEISCSKASDLSLECPHLGQEIILRMLDYLHPKLC